MQSFTAIFHIINRHTFNQSFYVGKEQLGQCVGSFLPFVVLLPLNQIKEWSCVGHAIK